MSALLNEAVHIPAKWVKLMRRICGLKPGRYMVLLNVHEDNASWSVCQVGKTEK